MKINQPSIIWSILFTFPFLSSARDEVPWMIGLADARITPRQAVLMYGYGDSKTQRKVASGLSVKALALEDPDGGRAVLVTCDLGSIHRDMTGRIAERLGKRHGLPRSAILFNVSHIHSGPLSWVPENLSPDVEAAAVEATAAYIVELEKTIEAVADRALAGLADRRPAALSWSLGVAPFVMNRRVFTERGVAFGVNPKGPVDRSVLVIRVQDADGGLRAIVMGVACHCTCASSANVSIDGDYAGHAQADLETRFPGAKVLFLAGCGGDADPWPRRIHGDELLHAREHGATLAGEVVRVLGGSLEPIRPPLRTAFREAALPVAPQPPREELEKMAAGRGWQRDVGREQLAWLERGRRPSAEFPMPVALWQFGRDFTLVGLGGEPVGDYVPLIDGVLGPLRLWVAGYCNDVFGYVPSRRILREGGYETRGIDQSRGGGQFAPEVEGVVLDTVEQLARESGRPE